MSTRISPWRLLVNNRLGLAGLVVFSACVLLALVTPWLPLPDPDLTDLANRLLPPGHEAHPLGTDHHGRDMLSRLLWGMRVSLFVGLSATLIAALCGSLIGLVAGFAGGRVDNILMRGIDMLMAFPYILLALAIVAALGPGLINALYAIAIVNIPFFARNVRGVTLSLASREFVDAARLSGKSPARILFSEILPNVMPVIVITITTTLGWMILETAGLSFLGLGAQPPQADLGSMLGDGRKFIFTAAHVSILPGLVIFFLVMAVNLTGDGIRDILDPRLKSGVLSRPAARTVTAVGTPSGASQNGGKLLEVRGLRTEFSQGDRQFAAIDDVSFDLFQGECLGLVGESGSGKTVTAMSLTGLVASPPGRITAGEVWFDGEELLSASDEQIRRIRGARIAHIFQDSLSALHPLYTIGEQLVEAIRAHAKKPAAEARATAAGLLRQVNIDNPTERLAAYPHQLSGGMRQRVSIAMARAHRPQLMIADEPTTALDVTVQAQVLRQMNALRRDNDTALLFITHDFAVVSQICDRVIVMYGGKIVESGATRAVIEAPQHPYTRMLMQCIPVLGEPGRDISAIPGQPPRLDAPTPGCAFAPRCPRARERCTSKEPQLAAAGSQRSVRCFYPLGEEA
jgi:peptide/nickel transport system permease protein